MGLDMYAYATDRNLGAEIDFACDEGDANFHTWRKHPNLHGWMQQLYLEKGGEAFFNDTTLLLTLADIDALEIAITDGTLPETRGFIGQSDGSELDDDLSFIAKARCALATGLAVYYRSCW